MKVFKYTLFVVVFIWLVWLCAILFASCTVTKASTRVVKQKTFYRVTPVDKDGKKEESSKIIIDR